MPRGPTTNFGTVRAFAPVFRHALSGAPRVLPMGTTRRFLFVTAALALSFASVTGATAGSLEWSADGVTPGSGGTGTWKTTTALWFNGITFQNWNNAALDDAVLGGTAGTVTLGTAITAHSLIFNVTGYTVTSRTLTLGGVTPTISVVTGGSATIELDPRGHGRPDRDGWRHADPHQEQQLHRGNDDQLRHAADGRRGQLRKRRRRHHRQ